MSFVCRLFVDSGKLATNSISPLPSHHLPSEEAARLPLKGLHRKWQGAPGKVCLLKPGLQVAR